MIFVHGYIHCDPHPGNVLIRRGVTNEVEIVMLDHGLYTVSVKQLVRILIINHSLNIRS